MLLTYDPTATVQNRVELKPMISCMLCCFPSGRKHDTGINEIMALRAQHGRPTLAEE
jgi:hypothetical protein